jgi:hypothetical protein
MGAGTRGQKNQAIILDGALLDVFGVSCVTHDQGKDRALVLQGAAKLSEIRGYYYTALPEML